MWNTQTYGWFWKPQQRREDFWDQALGHCKCPQVAWKGEPAQETKPGPTWRKKGQQERQVWAPGGVSFLLRGLAQGAELIPEDGG